MPVTAADPRDIVTDMEGDHLGFTVGHAERERVQVVALGRSHPEWTDFWDGNWLRTPITGSFGGFRFEEPDAQLRATEIRSFAQQLKALSARLAGQAHLSSIEDWIELSVNGDGSGRLHVTGAVRDSSSNSLQFVIPDFDQSFLAPLLGELDLLVSAFPVLGSPSD